MPLQNRVTPFGTIERDSARGLLMGNRGGRLHDPATRTLTRRRWTSHHWIICVTEFRQRRRTVMSPSSYTELFFLDEVTALAAGHRPCYECQRQRALDFAKTFAAGRGQSHIKAGEMDRYLHSERPVRGQKVYLLDAESVALLPDGVVVAKGSDCFATKAGQLLPWTHRGYRATVPIDTGQQYLQLTPPSTVAAIAAGFLPWFHPTATP
ncbi:MAG: hypothetical protein NXI27_18605 [Alphaproteobacteria bacterium]|nr:hypothetical protein [Alphaproteobacteria bacterium]